MPVVGPGHFENKSNYSQYLSQVMDLGSIHTERADKYRKCWNFWDGKHWGTNAPEGYDQVVVNYCKAFVNKLRRFTFRNDWTITVPNENETDNDEYLKYVWKKNDLHGLTTEFTTNGGIFGDYFAYVQWVKEEGKPGRIVITSLDPRYVFPEYETLTGELTQVVVLVPYEIRKFDAANNIFTGVNVIYREIHTREMTYKQLIDNNGAVLEYSEEPNVFDKIMIVHGVNHPIPNSNYGYSDVEDIIDLSRLLDEKVSDVSDIIDYHAAPITLIYGAKARQLEKGANKVWSGLPSNAKVENLKSEGNIEASMKFIDWIKSAMHELSNVPEDALGKGREMSNTSAVALSLDFEPLIEVAEDKRYSFTKFVKSINERIIDIKEEYNDKVPVSKETDKYEHNVDYGDLLPRDRQTELSEIETEMRLGLEIPRDALVRLGYADPDAKLKAIEEYQEEERQRNLEEQQDRIDMFAESAVDGNKIKDPDKAEKAIKKDPVVHGEQVTEENVKEKS